jgi:Na+/H+ antiporter NhaD/arsenite permease-like protein
LKAAKAMRGRHCFRSVSVNLCLFRGRANLAWTALAGAALVMVLARRDTHEVLKLVDWHLLVFFAALSVAVDGLSDTGCRMPFTAICNPSLDRM